MAHRLTDEMLGLLGRGPVAAADLAQGLKVDRTTVSRALQPQIRAGRVVRLLGATRGARYGRARPIGSVGTSWPLYRIDETGAPEQIATLQAIERNHFHCSTGPSRIARLVERIPYFLQDARPAGFLGRAIPAAYPVLGLPARVQDWTDEHVIVFLTQAGAESVGNLILGAEALNQYLAGDHGPPIVVAEERATRYPQLAAAAMIGAPPGSSAQGEHPKFAVRIAGHRELVHALVKFSPPRSTAAGERWADLLIAESWALRVLAEQGIPVAHTELHEYGEQVFLQSERFDRVGADGRRGVVTLFSVDADRYGRLDSWSAAAERL
ncbi:MAG TPA: HipA domain-containing protein, partial [Steroidobacteraceae bacterium]